jgi:hypothetical protein
MGNTAMVGAEQQHLRALEHANKVRLARARLKREIASGEVSVAKVIVTCPWYAHSMEISDLLMSQKRWGRARCKRLLVAIGIRENKPLVNLTERQRIALVGMLSAKMGAAAPAQGMSRPAAAHPAAMTPSAPLAREGVLSAA